MLYRKYAKNIEDFILNQHNKILLVNGARQIGKSYIIRYVGKRLFKNFVEVNLKEDSEGDALFSKVKQTDDLYLLLSSLYGSKLGRKENTLSMMWDCLPVYCTTRI